MNMVRELNKYLISGQLVEIIYLDRHGKTSKRRLKLHSIVNDQLKSYCYTRRAFRVFTIDNILAVSPVMRHVV